MKTTIRLSLILISVVFFYCKKEDPKPDTNVSGTDTTRYLHEIPNCDLSRAIGCTESVQFRDDTLAHVVLEGDILVMMKYSISNDTIIFKDPTSHEIKFKFVKTHPDTLIRIPGGEKWVKKKK